MSGKFLLDTNAVIAFMRMDANLREKIDGLKEIYISVTIVGELYFGAFKSAKVKENLKDISTLLKTITVLDNDVDTARMYGEIKNQLRAKGKPIPENDIWIAAIARQFDLIIVTNDRHFNEIENLKLSPV